MKQKENKSTSGMLYGLTFITPVVYSLALQEMDNMQKLVFSGLALIIFLTVIRSLKNIEVISLNKYLMLTILFFPISFLTAFINNSENNLPLLLTNILFPISLILLTVFMLKIYGEEKFFKVVSFSVVYISTLFALIGLLEVFKLSFIPLPTIIPPGSTIGHRSFAVEYLLSSIPFILILKEYIRKQNYPWLLISLFINISFVLFTRSRSAMLVLIIIIIIYFIYSFTKMKQKVKQLLPIAGIIVAALIFSFLPAEGSQRTDIKKAAESLFDTEFRSNRLRLTYWDASFQMIKENPLIGMGLFKWSGYYPKYFGKEFNDNTIFYMQSTHAHNDFLELFAENGFLSPLVYLFILFLILKSTFIKSKTNSLYFFVFLSVISTAIFSLVAFPLYKLSSHFYLSVCTGIALVGIKHTEKKSILIKFKYLKTIFILILGIVIITSFIKLKSELNYIDALDCMNRKSFAKMNEKLDDVSRLFYPYNPPKQPVDYYRGVVNSFTKNYTKALKYYLQAEELAPFSPVILNGIATVYRNMGNTAEAISRFEKLKVLFPEYSDPQIKLLYLYVAEKQEAKGKKLLTELISKFPDNPNLLKIKKMAFQNE